MKALERFIRWVCRDVTYDAHYPATVELVHADGSVDVTPDDDAIRGEGLSSIRPAPGLPATDIVPAPGARCLVAFRPDKTAFIAEWESGSSGIERVHLDHGQQGIAGMGDPLEVLFPSGPVPISGFLVGTLQPPGVPPPPPIPFPAPGIPVTGTAVIKNGDVVGTITTGNPKVLR